MSRDVSSRVMEDSKILIFTSTVQTKSNLKFRPFRTYLISSNNMLMNLPSKKM